MQKNVFSRFTVLEWNYVYMCVQFEKHVEIN